MTWSSHTIVSCVVLLIFTTSSLFAFWYVMLLLLFFCSSPLIRWLYLLVCCLIYLVFFCSLILSYISFTPHCHSRLAYIGEMQSSTIICVFSTNITYVALLLVLSLNISSAICLRRNGTVWYVLFSFYSSFARSLRHTHNIDCQRIGGNKRERVSPFRFISMSYICMFQHFLHFYCVCLFFIIISNTSKWIVVGFCISFFSLFIETLIHIIIRNFVRLSRFKKYVSKRILSYS